ncbi:DNA-methyltransferase [Breznakia pachnodae]|uniref:DNA modification methylase n=1 Tax=Breznakia pachnodae TaxID=265178 RepID=A0ABU0E3W4_9FIRM|nr:site-specific DNA-methyltransferase [Breznakia pachnodae]MDQ0361582.1 DNA modification methylase [Breznakia pachnodae]
MIESNSIDAIITDHLYLIEKSHKGGNRNFTSEYECFNYEVSDFEEKIRVLKPGGFMIEFIPEENADNYNYLFNMKEMAKQVGFEYYSKVPWNKGIKHNVGRKQKMTEDILFMSKGKARSLRRDVKKDKQDPTKEHFMSGTNGMLPAEFEHKAPIKNERIHQAEKPVELIEELIEFVTKENETILDQFGGSLNTGKAALNKSRNAIVIESDYEMFMRNYSIMIEDYPNVNFIDCIENIKSVNDIFKAWNKCVEEDCEYAGLYYTEVKDEDTVVFCNKRDGNSFESDSKDALKYIQSSLDNFNELDRINIAHDHEL